MLPSNQPHEWDVLSHGFSDLTGGTDSQSISVNHDFSKQLNLVKKEFRSNSRLNSGENGLIAARLRCRHCVHFSAYIRPTRPAPAHCNRFSDYIQPTYSASAKCNRFSDYIWPTHPAPAHCNRFSDYIQPTYSASAKCSRFSDYIQPVRPAPAHCNRFFDYIRSTHHCHAKKQPR